MSIKTINNISINNYANSMFRYEFFNDAWIDNCTRYLIYLFKDIKGKTIVDYAFGRGNWSLAFLKAGAKHVYSIDASIDNCTRFAQYCEKNNITNITIIHSNILEESLPIKCDLIWLYGVLHHISEVSSFLEKLKSLLGDGGRLYAYYYNKNSPRNLIVDMCRQLYHFTDETEFSTHQWLFPLSIKNRASDDLVAPYIDWKTLHELSSTFKNNGFAIVEGPTIDFSEFLSGQRNHEFYPHQILCTLENIPSIQPIEPKQPFANDIQILKDLLSNVFAFERHQDESRYLCIGLYNAYFLGLKTDDVPSALLGAFIFSMRVILNDVNKHNRILTDDLKIYYELLLLSLQDKKRTQYLDKIDNIFSQHLINHKLRL